MHWFLRFLLLISLLVFSSSVIAAGDGVTRITKEELKAKLDKGEKIIILDVRTKSSYNGSTMRIKGDVRKEPDMAESWYKELPMDKEIVTYCT
ncbi:MAG: rhodanese-like domain-containing protein [Nitrospirota bacterium]